MKKSLCLIFFVFTTQGVLASGMIEKPKEPPRCQELRTQLESWEKKAKSGTGGYIEERKNIDSDTQYREKRKMAEYVSEQIRDIKKEMSNLECAAWGGL